MQGSASQWRCSIYRGSFLCGSQQVYDPGSKRAFRTDDLFDVAKNSITLSEYVRRRNGVPLGGSGALREMLKRSLGAKSTTVFWQFWNPIFGYYLGKYVYRPARSLGLPNAVATITTFCVSGAIHDLAATAVSLKAVFVCTPAFFFMALGLLLSRSFNMDLSGLPWIVRAGFHMVYLGTCVALALVLKNAGVLY